MKIEKVLENLEELFNKWGISSGDWIFAAQYAERLLGYEVKVREGHLNIIVNGLKVPWDVGDELETHAPVGTKFANQYEEFMKKTHFEFDFLPVSAKDFNEKLKHTIKYEVSLGKSINVQTPWGGLLELDDILSKCKPEGWGEEKGYRVFPHLEDIRRVALKKGEVKLAKAYRKLAKKYIRFKRVKKVSVPDKLQGIKRFTGIIASKGKVKATVNVVLDPEITKRFEEGEILVTTMTSPKFTPFFTKASAIVTDEGGMLSHAAIVARELGIPCMVGTKIATKVLKDGDLVEVDAEKGVVRKISR